MHKIFAICNQKGGVAKTTTAINLSSYLANLGYKVLLVDLDPQSNATSGIGIDKRRVKSSIYDLLIKGQELSQTILDTQVKNLHIIPSNLNLTGAEIELVSVIGRESKLHNILHQISKQYEFIFIDCPPSLGILTINALVAAKSVIIPIQCEYFALEGLTQLINTVNLVKTNLNPLLDVGGVLLTMADYRTKLTQEVIKEIQNYFKEKVFDTVIPRNIKLTEAPGFGKPILLYDNQSPGAQKYEEFAKEFAKRFSQVAIKEQVTNINTIE